jgi:hypothetical protein
MHSILYARRSKPDTVLFYRMEWQLPVQKLEVGSIYIASPWLRESKHDIKSNPMSALSYIGAQFRLPSLSILFPPLPIVEYVPSSGRLVIDISETNLACTKLAAFQETILQSILCHQLAWFGTEYTIEEIRSKYTPIYKDNRLILHCPLTTYSGSHGPRVYAGGVWDTDYSQLKSGARIRVAVKLHGISYLYNKNNHVNLLAEVPEGVDTRATWNGKTRIQHKILGILLQT